MFKGQFVTIWTMVHTRQFICVFRQSACTTNYIILQPVWKYSAVVEQKTERTSICPVIMHVGFPYVAFDNYKFVVQVFIVEYMKQTISIVTL